MVLAALGHDLGHFGRNNNFLIATRHDLATTYNDKSVLENFHTASLFKLLDKDRCAERGVDLLAEFDREDYRQSRQLIIALIFATDTSHHLDALASFRLRLSTAEAAEEVMALSTTSTTGKPKSSFDPLEHAGDQQEALAFMMRAADIGHSAKLWDMHHAWSVKVTEEFHSQGDEEQRLGLPISPLCGREGFVLASSQMGFLQFICLPTWTALVRFEAYLAVHLDVGLLRSDAVNATDSCGGALRISTDTNPIVFEMPLSGGRSIAKDCLEQCDANFHEWKRQAEAIKHAKFESEAGPGDENQKNLDVPSIMAKE